jgi:hypothetical protein
MFFETIEAALEYIWALPLGIGKLLSLGGGGYLVTKMGQSIFGNNNNNTNNK